jgi:hypothetical protein
MPARLTYEEVYEYIRSKGYELLSKEYNHAKEKLNIKCGVCHEEYKQVFGYCQNKEKKRFGGYKTPFKLVPIICKVCKKEFQPKHSTTKLCSAQCNKNICSIPEYLERARLNCKKSRTTICRKSIKTKQKRNLLFRIMLAIF